jgi:hypothetical protein
MHAVWLALALAGDPVEVTGGLDAYLAERLDVVQRPVSTVYAKAYDGSGTFWFVTQGGKGLSAATFAEAVGDVELARTHRRKQRTATTVGLSSLVLGAAAVTGALVRGAIADASGAEVSPVVGMGLLGAGVVGVVAGPLVLTRPVRMGHPSTLYTEDEALQRAQAQNAALRARYLGEEEPEG